MARGRKKNRTAEQIEADDLKVRMLLRPVDWLVSKGQIRRAIGRLIVQERKSVDLAADDFRAYRRTLEQILARRQSYEDDHWLVREHWPAGRLGKDMVHEARWYLDEMPDRGAAANK